MVQESISSRTTTDLTVTPINTSDKITISDITTLVSITASSVITTSTVAECKCHY